MSAEQSPRDLMNAKWYLKELVGHNGTLPTAACAFIYSKAVIEIASADGSLNEKELNWILGFAASIGTPQYMIDQLKSYKPGQCIYVEYLFKDIDQKYAQVSRLSLLYAGLRAASASGELPPSKLKTIQIFGKKLGLTEDKIEQCRLLAEEDENLRQKRAKLLFPEGVEYIITLLNKIV